MIPLSKRQLFLGTLVKVVHQKMVGDKRPAYRKGNYTKANMNMKVVSTTQFESV